MTTIYDSVSQLIGKTPMLHPRRLCEHEGLSARLLLKLEGMNPGGSVKDRVALQMLLDAEEKGTLAPGGTVIEPTSGNTGIGLAAMAAARGYRAIIVMPDSMSAERRLLIAAYGADLVLTPGSKGMAGAIEKARELQSTIPGSVLAGQFENPANPQAHYRITGPEIWEDSQGNVDIFVAGVGTGGTVTGVGKYLKEQNPALQAIAVEPADSPVLSGGKAGSHGIQGIGAGFIPQVLALSVIDAITTVDTADAYAAARLLARQEGILVGISSGAALHAAIALCKKPENAEKTVVALLPDSGERYLSTGLFAD